MTSAPTHDPEAALSAQPAAILTLASAPQQPISIAQLEQLAATMGCIVTPISKWARAVAHSIATGLRTREGEFIYQSAAIRVPEIPRQAAEQIFQWAPKSSSLAEVIWTCDSATEAAQHFSDILPLSGLRTTRATRAIQRPSEPVIRVLATMMGGVEIRHATSSSGVEVLTINFLYVLTGEMGDLHPPKDPERREIALSPAEETELRQLILRDATELGRAGAKLSPGWWRQVGDESRALQEEAHLANLEAMRAAATPDAPARIRSRDSYNVEAILGLKRRGWLRVAWEGYHPAWEEWRKEGEVGVAPVITWEPRKRMANTEAYATWIAAQEAQAATQVA